MKLDNFLIVRRTFYLGSKITTVESLLTVIVVSHWLTSVNVAEVGDVRHLLQKREVQHPGLDERPGPPDVDCLAPLPGLGVEHVDVGVAVDHQEPVRRGGDGQGLGRVHDLNLPGLAALQVHVDPEAVEDQQELSLGQLDGPESVDGIEGEEAQHLVVRVDERERVLVA